MRRLLICVIAAGCGPSSPQPVQPAQPAQVAPTGPSNTSTNTVATVGPTADKPTPDVVCNHLLALEAEQCGEFGSKLNMSRAECTKYFTTELNPHDAKQRDEIGTCLVDPAGCKGVLACLASSPNDGADQADLRTCADTDDRAVGVAAAEYAQHNGSSAKHYTEIKSTKDAPIERCGIPDENRWLGSLTCADGSRPIQSAADAERTRVGNVGPGGRCHAIIDLYRVPCPEGSTDIFLDAYVCPKP